jgi:hypothetical protein
MAFFKKRYPTITSPQVVELLRLATVDMNYSAVLALHDIYVGAAAPEDLWDYWIDQIEPLAGHGYVEVVAMAIDFCRKANIDPWGSLRSDQYDRLRELERR